MLMYCSYRGCSGELSRSSCPASLCRVREHRRIRRLYSLPVRRCRVLLCWQCFFHSSTEENLSANLTLSDICQKFYMGKSCLSKLFLEHMGCAPMEYYRKIKIREAKKLISSGVSVTRVSDMLGYSSVHNFSRAFKKYTGTSPTEYKKKINPMEK